MKKIALILTLPLTFSLAVVAQSKKDSSKASGKSTETVANEQHIVLTPADLK